jgi:GNAT superfamily N-acetyltransferase
MLVREPVAEDAEKLAEVQSASWSAGYGDILPADVIAKMNGRRIAQWSEFLSARQCEKGSLICELDGRIAGLSLYGPSRDEDNDRQAVIELYSLYIHPDFWRHGCGRALCAAILKRVRETGARRLIVWTLRDNQRAQRFYESVGFVLQTKTKLARFAGGEWLETQFAIDLLGR